MSASPRVALPAATDLPALVAGLVTVTLWGSAFVGIRAAGEAFSPGPLALGRLVVSSLILGTVALVRREPLPSRGNLVRIAVYGILWLGVYSVSLNAAEQQVDAGTAAMLINTGPLLIVLLAGGFLGEGFPRGLLTGCLIAFGGCVLIGVATSSTGSRGGLGIALCLLAALAYASAVVVQKPVLSRIPPLQVTCLGCLAATLVCLPVAPQLAAQTANASASAIAWTVYLGALPTTVGFLTWSFALKRTSAGSTASLAYLIPVVAVVLGWLVLAEVPPLLAVIGGGLCLLGVWVSRRR